MKKFVCALAAVVLLFAFCLPCSAAQAGKLTVKSTQNGEDSLSLEFCMEQNPGIIAAGFEISYNTQVLALSKAENGEIFSRVYVQSQHITDEPYRMLWADVTAKADCTKDGVLMRLTFHILKKNTAAEITVRPMAGNIFNHDLADRDIAGCSFALSVQQGGNSSSATGSAGSSSAGETGGVVIKDYKQLPVTEKAKNSGLATASSAAASAAGGQSSTQSGTAGLAGAGSTVQGSSEAAPAANAEVGSEADFSSMANGKEQPAKSTRTVLYAALAAAGILVAVGVVIVVLKNQSKAVPAAGSAAEPSQGAANNSERSATTAEGGNSKESQGNEPHPGDQDSTNS